MARTYVGTAGWSYADWEGVVYPESKGAGFHPLAFLADYVDMVEINSTFYRPATPAMAAAWLRRVAERPDFLFAVKLHQIFTHQRGEFTEKDVAAFKAGIDLLRVRNRIAALLVQFPWSYNRTPENTAYLLRLFGLFAEYPLALEIRHESWNTPEFYDLLGANRVAFCNIDQPLFKDSIAPSSVVTNPDYSYVRLHGRNYKNWFRQDAGRDDRYDYLYSRDELGDWVRRIRELGARSGKVYVVTNNHYRGQAVANALQIRNMITGKKVDVPRLMLEKYPALKDIVRKIQSGQMDLFHNIHNDEDPEAPGEG